MSSNPMIRFHKILCSFKQYWPPENRGIEMERFSKARNISLYHNIKALYTVGLKTKLCVLQQ